MDGNFIAVMILAALVAGVIGFFIGRLFSQFFERQKFEFKIKEEREDAIAKSRSVLAGQFSEQLAPFLPNFKYSPSEARFLGKPIDLIIFRGLDNKNIEEIIFVEVKSGRNGGSFNSNERSLQTAIENGRVRYEVYQVPNDLVKR